MDPVTAAFSTKFLTGIATSLTMKILAASGRSLRATLETPEKRKALERCIEAGVVALVARSSADAPEERDHLAGIFEAFSREPDVGIELAALIRGNPLDFDALAGVFDDAGYVEATLPGLDFKEGMTAFQIAFFIAATEEPELQGIIQTNLLLAQTQLQRELVAAMKELVGLVRRAQSGTIGIEAGEVSAAVEGEKVVYVLQPQIITSPVADEIHPLRSAYLNHLFDEAAQLSLRGIDPKAASNPEAHIRLDAVYTALLTRTARENDSHDRSLMERGEMADRDPSRFSALAQLDRHRRLVLLGDPGGGKSTFVNFVAICLAGEALGKVDVNLDLLRSPLPDDDGTDGDEPQPWDHGSLLPVRIILRDFAARGLPPAGQPATADHLWRFVAGEMRSATLGDFAPHLHRELLEKGGIVLLDGLDEVPEADQRREQIKEAVEDFASVFHRCRFLVTSRTYAYQKQAWRLRDFRETVLAPFSRGQITRFVDRWYGHLAALHEMHADDARGGAALLKGAIFGSDRLQALAERPLLITLMASLHAWRGGTLPEKREELYDDTVDLLLDLWESPKTVRDADGEVKVLQPSLAEWLKADRKKVRDQLNELAYKAHAAQTDLDGTADIPEKRLVKGLLDISDRPDLMPGRLLEYLRDRAGLLLPRGDKIYTFPHRTFQEYLAACHLTDHDYPDKIADLVRKDPDRWREVTLLAGAKAARGTDSAIWLLAEELCRHDPVENEKERSEDVWGAQMAGLALAETANLEKVSRRNESKLDRVREWLIALLGQGLLPSVERAIAGDSLARIGDTRPGVGVLAVKDNGVSMPDIRWCHVHPGPFRMGEGREEHRNETLAYSYWISRYPVTNRQFELFAKAGGYQIRRYWTDAGWAWREKEGVQAPPAVGKPWTLSNRPIVAVTWYEAVAYCRWLTEQLQQCGLLEEIWEVYLPSEAEWEKAARGGLEMAPEPTLVETGQLESFVDPGPLLTNPRPSNPYPWGDEANANRANYHETGIGETSAVGCFPGGESPSGCLDMSGNVWEWTRSVYQGYPYQPDDGREDLEAGDNSHRVLRGGAFRSNFRYVRCAARYWKYPSSRGGSSGMRVVVTPFF